MNNHDHTPEQVPEAKRPSIIELFCKSIVESGLRELIIDVAKQLQEDEGFENALKEDYEYDLDEDYDYDLDEDYDYDLDEDFKNALIETHQTSNQGTAPGDEQERPLTTSQTLSQEYSLGEIPLVQPPIEWNRPMEIQEMSNPSAPRVSDQLESVFQQWNSFNPVLLDAPTGLGKNYFITHSLIPFAKSKNRNVYIFSNRIALNIQQKKEVLLARKCGIWQNDKELQNTVTFENVHIISYQNVLSCFAQYSQALGDDFTPTGYAIFDEAHFFLSDATMNPDTYRIYEKLLLLFNRHIRIYMSATLKPFLPRINHLEHMTYRRHFLSYPDMSGVPQATNTKDRLTVLEFSRQYAQYDISFFTLPKTIDAELAKATKDDKWLYFLDNISEQKELNAKLKDKASYINRSNRSEDNKAWRSLAEGRLSTPILLATSVIDNGINITDPDLHHIVLDCTDFVSFFQLLGRKRLLPEETVKLYVHCPDEKTVKRRLKRLNELKDICLQFYQKNTYLMRNIWSIAEQDVRDLFWVDDYDRIQLNHFALDQIQYLIDFWSELLFKMQTMAIPAGAYPSMVRNWMNLINDDTSLGYMAAEEENALREKVIQLIVEHQETNDTPDVRNEKRFELFEEVREILGPYAIKTGKRVEVKSSHQGIIDFIADNNLPIKEDIRNHFVRIPPKSEPHPKSFSV